MLDITTTTAKMIHYRYENDRDNRDSYQMLLNFWRRRKSLIVDGEKNHREKTHKPQEPQSISNVKRFISFFIPCQLFSSILVCLWYVPDFQFADYFIRRCCSVRVFERDLSRVDQLLFYSVVVWNCRNAAAAVNALKTLLRKHKSFYNTSDWWDINESMFLRRFRLTLLKVGTIICCGCSVRFFCASLPR